MKRIDWTIAGYTVTSWGNGLSYTITAPDGRDCFLQGDDAAAWRAEYDAADDTPDGAGAFLAETVNLYASPD